MRTLQPVKGPFWTPLKLRILFLAILIFVIAAGLGVLGAMEPVEIYNYGGI